MNLNLEKDENKINFTPNDIFDRIINLKVKVGRPATSTSPAEVVDEFVIRSDYEVFYRASDSIFYDGKNSGDYIIRRCTMKPSIKVHCNMVTANVGTEIDVFISNFFLLSSDGKYLRDFSMREYAVLEVEIYMGYWGQFANTLNADSTIEDYFNLKAQNGADKIVIGNPIIVTTDKLPPDSTLHMHGYVANVLSSPIAVSQHKDYASIASKPVIKSGDGLEELFFNFITRRYLKYNTIYKTKRAKAVSESKPDKVPETDKTGMMTKEDAEKYGVKVILSSGARAFIYNNKKDNEGGEQEAKIYFEAGDTIGNTITRMLSSINSDLNYRFSNNGDLLIFLNSEQQDIESLAKSFGDNYKDNNFSSYYGNKLPAVYNITLDGVTSIVCPFFSFIEPFQIIEFSSRYTLSSLVSYAVGYPSANNQFIAIRASISFATVESVNEVTISAIVKN